MISLPPGRTKHQRTLRSELVWVLACLAVLPAAVAAEKRVDNPVDAWMIAGTGPAGKAVESSYARRPELLDTTDSKQGDFSIVFKVGDPARQGAVGFSPGQFLDPWAVDKEFALHLWVRIVAPQASKPCALVLYDAGGQRAVADLPGLTGDGQWREFTVPLGSMKLDGAFQFSAVRAVQVEGELPKDARLWLDDVYFKKADQELGITDKTITQYMAEAAATRPKRVAAAFPLGTWGPGLSEAAALWSGKDVEKANQKLTQDFKSAMKHASVSWNLHEGSMMHLMYYGFSSKGRIKKGMLTPECEKALLDLIWEHNKLNNDIAIARQSTWWMTGSENHDINFKMCNLLASQILMAEPEYAKRIYPDLGRMVGYGYGAGMYQGEAGSARPYGRGNYKDGKDYTAADHYQAWVKFWKEWFAERAKHGFFVEHNASGYMKYTLNFLNDIYAWSDDEAIRRDARMFIDLVWAQWAQDQLLTCTGGAGTRMRGYGYQAMSDLSVFLLGGPGGSAQTFFQLLSDYQWPRAVWEMMLDRRGKGEYAFVSRKPNEEQDLWPRPAGLEYAMLIRPDSRLARYSWVTPDYVLGVRMDHPAAMYCHLAGSTQGLIFGTTPDANIMFSFQPGAMYRAVQDRNVLVMKPKESWLTRHPEWFMGWQAAPSKSVIQFGKVMERVEENDGWVFVKEGNAYAAIRFVHPAKRVPDQPLPRDADGYGLLTVATDTYLSADRRSMNGDMMTVLVEAGRREQFPTLEDFQKDVLDNPLVLREYIGGFWMTYKGCGKDAKEITFSCSNNEFPMVDGKHISYDCPAFDSPWLKGAHGSGVITLIAPISGRKTVLDFNKIEQREEK